MGKSARILGMDLHLTAEEMNELLKQNGLLEGEPGQYDVTETGKLYATERNEHRGTGGYSFYNRAWTIRTWDDSVIEAMDTSPEMIQKARDNVSERRKARRVSSEEEASNDGSNLAVPDEIGGTNDTEKIKLTDYVDSDDLLKAAAVVGALIGVAVAAPHIKRFYDNKVKPTCKRVWCKVTKKPYIEPDAVTESNEEDVTAPEHMEGKDAQHSRKSPV